MIDSEADHGLAAARTTTSSSAEASDPEVLVRLLHPDLYGRAKSKQFPAAVFEHVDGVTYCLSSMAETLEGEPLTGGAFPADRGHPDMTARPDRSTSRIVPWDDQTAWVLADLVDETSGVSAPNPLCQRELVRRAVRALDVVGYAAEVAAELEFYLVEPDGTGRPPLYSPAGGMVYTAGRRSDPRGVVGAMQRALGRLGIPVTSAGREFSPGQFEINLAHRDPLSAADDAFLFKEAVKDLAASFGLQAVFMARPFSAHSGSSMHLHLSLTRDGCNVFSVDPATRDRFVSGLVRHAPALTAIASSTVNSYKRLNGGGVVAPIATTGADNREAWVRIPAEGGAAARLELRAGDAATNPYLLIAATIYAGLDGLADDRDTPTGAPLPVNLDAAIDALTADEWLTDRLGSEIAVTFCALKRDEADRFARAVTDWEWFAYHLHA